MSTSTPLYCSFCNEDGHVISQCNSPEVHQLCASIRERAFTAYDYKSEHHLLHVFLCYPENKLEMLYNHWKATCNPVILQQICNIDTLLNSDITDIVNNMTYSKMVALNMWLYLYVEIYDLQNNEAIDDEFQHYLLTRKTFWFNAWSGQNVWYANPIYNNSYLSEGQHTSSDAVALLPNNNLNINIDIQLSNHVLSADDECPICYNELDMTRVLPACGHPVCSDCFKKCMNSSHLCCSICRSNIMSIIVFCPSVNESITKCLASDNNESIDSIDELDSIVIDLNLFGYI